LQHNYANQHNYAERVIVVTLVFSLIENMIEKEIEYGPYLP